MKYWIIDFMANEGEQPEIEDVIFSDDSFVTEDGANKVLSREEADVDKQAINFFLEEASLTLGKEFESEDIATALEYSQTNLGPTLTAYVIGCDAEEIDLFFDLSNEKVIQSAAKKLKLMELWVTANSVIAQPFSSEEHIDQSTPAASFSRGRQTLLSAFPELGEMSLPRYLRDKDVNIETVETIHHVLWQNYYGAWFS